MTFQFADFARQAASDRAISADEILALRQAGWNDGKIGADEAEALIAVNAALERRPAEWCDYFVEAICEYVINGAAPRGYVSEDNARWLIGHLDRDGELDSLVELELLVRLLGRAVGTPEVLKTYAIEQIERAVLTGSGPTRDGGELSASHITACEARLLRRVLFAPGSDGPASISQREAELLFRLKDAALRGPNAPEWKQVFVQGVGNYLQGLTSPGSHVSRERAAELEAFMDSPGAGIGGFLGRMAKESPNVFGVVFGRKAPERDPLVELAEAEQVTGEERAWLDAHIDADGTVDEYERALLDFLDEDASRTRI
ncbi:MAG: hypothetical protein B7Z08_07665 [Sphingomonadales bacterium 32-68-7]|nr:MAG: hypothetical protein B7Z33_01765 [Sphingomonadales bacterium 12-68-11]OYX08844.1 MAG: hypothetical protein B7Z08_07665 [Sphingomonadales bacterium 32-68-7]